MAVVILPDARVGLLLRHDYTDEGAWLKAEDEIFDKLEKVEAGIFSGPSVPEPASVGMPDYQHVYTSHHKFDLPTDWQRYLCVPRCRAQAGLPHDSGQTLVEQVTG